MHWTVYIAAIAVVIWVGRLGCWLVDRWHTRSTLRLIEEYERAFPGKCVICGFHRYGVSHGFVAADEPVGPHDGCPEGNGL